MISSRSLLEIAGCTTAAALGDDADCSSLAVLVTELGTEAERVGMSPVLPASAATRVVVVDALVPAVALAPGDAGVAVAVAVAAAAAAAAGAATLVVDVLGLFGGSSMPLAAASRLALASNRVAMNRKLSFFWLYMARRHRCANVRWVPNALTLTHRRERYLEYRISRDEQVDIERLGDGEHGIDHRTLAGGLDLRFGEMLLGDRGVDRVQQIRECLSILQRERADERVRTRTHKQTRSCVAWFAHSRAHMTYGEFGAKGSDGLLRLHAIERRVAPTHHELLAGRVAGRLVELEVALPLIAPSKNTGLYTHGGGQDPSRYHVRARE